MTKQRNEDSTPEKEPEGMVITGDLASLNTTEASKQPSVHDGPSEGENGHAEEEDDEEVVVIEPVQPKASVAGTKRKLEEDDRQPTEKRMRVSEVTPIEV